MRDCMSDIGIVFAESQVDTSELEKFGVNVGSTLIEEYDNYHCHISAHVMSFAKLDGGQFEILCEELLQRDNQEIVELLRELDIFHGIQDKTVCLNFPGLHRAKLFRVDRKGDECPLENSSISIRRAGDGSWDFVNQ